MSTARDAIGLHACDDTGITTVLVAITYMPYMYRVHQSPHPYAGSHYKRPSSGSREAICKVPTTTAACSLHAYSYIQQSGRSVKSTNAKIRNKSPIHENADANITCDFVSS